MLDLLIFIFSGPWTFLGFVILLSIVSMTLIMVAKHAFGPLIAALAVRR